MDCLSLYNSTNNLYPIDSAGFCRQVFRKNYILGFESIFSLTNIEEIYSFCDSRFDIPFVKRVSTN